MGGPFPQIRVFRTTGPTPVEEPVEFSFDNLGSITQASWENSEFTISSDRIILPCQLLVSNNWISVIFVLENIDGVWRNTSMIGEVSPPIERTVEKIHGDLLVASDRNDLSQHYIYRWNGTYFVEEYSYTSGPTSYKIAISDEVLVYSIGTVLLKVLEYTGGTWSVVQDFPTDDIGDFSDLFSAGPFFFFHTSINRYRVLKWENDSLAISGMFEPTAPILDNPSWIEHSLKSVVCCW